METNEIFNDIINRIIHLIPFTIILIGIIGSFCNILTFTSKELRFNSCAFYILCSTIFDFIYLSISGIKRLLADHFSTTLFNKSNIICKFRVYLVVLIPVLSTNFLMLASLDRCLSTSNSRKWRNLSRMNIAWRLTMINLILTILSTSHIMFLYELRLTNSNHTEIYVCVPQDHIYTIIITICFFLTSPFITYTIMFISTITTLIRIRTSIYRMISLLNQKKRKRKRNHKRIDRHLITLLFVQVGLGIILTFFRCGYLVYSLSTIKTKKSLHKIKIESFFDKFSLFIYYMNFAKSFPVNTLTSPLFRRIFYQRITHLIKSIYCY